MKNKFFYVLLAAATLMSGQLLADPVNIIINGDFEAGNTGFSSGYTYSPGNLWDPETYDIVSDPQLSHSLAASFGDHTSGSGYMMAINGSETAGVSLWLQPVSVIPDALYRLSFWVANWYPSAPTTLEVQINGESIGSISPTGVGVWQEFTADWLPNGATSASIGIVSLGTAYSGNDYALDDISFVDPPITTPEPSTLLLSGFGFLGLALIRKRLG
jgi:hypothetical protein